MESTGKNIYYSAEFFFYILKSMGLAPYRFDKESQSLKMNFWNHLQFVVAVVIWIILIYVQLGLYDGLKFETGIQSSFLERLWKYQYILQHYLAIAVIIFSYLKREHVENYLKQIFTFDQIVEKLNWRVKVVHSRMHVLLFYLISMLMILFYMIFAIHIYGIYGKISMNPVTMTVKFIQYIVMNEFVLIVSLQFILSTHCIKSRLTAILQNIR